MINKKTLLLLFILSCALFVRFYNFSERINFGPEQAISLIVSGDYIKDKFTLLGDPNVQRVTSSGLRIFHLPIFNYSLVPLLLIFNYDPVPITFYFGILNLFTGFIIFVITKRMFDFRTGVFSMIIFLFNNVMVNHSLFIWNQHYIPLLAAISIWLVYKIKQKANEKNIKYGLLLGFISGLIFGTQYLYIPMMFCILGLVLFLSKNKITMFITFMLGLIISLLPMLIFDLKHDFYYLKTLIQYILDTFHNSGQSMISYYHFLPLWPLFAIAGGWIISKIFQKNIYLAILLLSLYVYINLSSALINFNEAIGMNKGLNYGLFNQAARSIALDKPKKFNIATTWDFDSQAHPLRYLLKFRYQTAPLGVEEYRNVDNIYIMANPEYDLKNSKLFEITEFKPFKVEQLAKISNDYSIFKLNH